MFVRSLELVRFRNYGRWRLEPGPEVTVLVGPNAAGKTNAMEAMRLVTAGESFRHPAWGELVRWGAEEARVAMAADGETGPLEVALRITADGKRGFSLDGAGKRRTSDVAGRVPSVVFTPDDLHLVKGSADVRRAAIDGVGDQASAVYRRVRRDYGKVVRQRNVLLKGQGGETRELAPWDEQLAVLGGKLLTLRVRLLLRLIGQAERAYGELTGGERLSATYEDKAGIGWDRLREGLSAEEAAQAIARRLRDRAAEELSRQVSLVGPHRDDIAFEVGGRSARRFGSQGQQRTAALAWKLAELEFLEDALGKRPVLLLDDVMSELDEGRRQALTGAVTAGVQTFITTTNAGYFTPGLLERATVVELGKRPDE